MVRDWPERRAGGPATLYERAVRAVDRAGVDGARRRLVAAAPSPVLEIGAGPGAALEHYPAGTVVTALEPEPHFRSAARDRAHAVLADVRVVAGDAHDLPFGGSSFASVVTQLTLCSVAQPDVALAEAYRVLRVGGRLNLLEHVRHPHPWVGRLQDAVDPVWTRLEGRGCRLGRDTPRAVEEAGFVVDEVEKVTMPPGAGLLFPMVIVRAHRSD